MRIGIRKQVAWDLAAGGSTWRVAPRPSCTAPQMASLEG